MKMEEESASISGCHPDPCVVCSPFSPTGSNLYRPSIFLTFGETDPRTKNIWLVKAKDSRTLSLALNF